LINKFDLQMNPQNHMARNLIELTASLSALFVSNVPIEDTPNGDPTCGSLELVGFEPERVSSFSLALSLFLANRSIDCLFYENFDEFNLFCFVFGVAYHSHRSLKRDRDVAA
jgi:hypothetical protein